MDIRRIITESLGLQDVIIEDIKQFKTRLRMEVTVRCQALKSRCHDCGNFLRPKVHQWELRPKIKGPPFGVYRDVIIKLWHPRSWCEHCHGVRKAWVPFIHPRFESMTCGFAETAGRLMEETTCEAASRLLNFNSVLLWRLDQWRMQHMLQRLELPSTVDLSFLSADEVHFKTLKIENRRGLWARRYRPEYITNLVSYQDGKVLFNSLGRDSKSLENCLIPLTDAQKQSCQFFAVDLHEPFISVARTDLPNAKICVDRFHLAKALNEAFDRVRRAEFRLAKERKDNLSHDMLLPHRRFILVSRQKELSSAESRLLDKLRKANLNIHTAMLLVEYLHKALDKATVIGFRETLKTWYQVVREAKLLPFRKLAATIRRYRRLIENYIASRLTTAVSEGLNNKIKTLKRMGYGYTNPTSFRHKILQRCGYLNHHHINTDEFLFRMPFHT